MPIVAISRATGLSRDTIQKTAESIGLPSRRRHFARVSNAAIRKAWRTQKALPELAAELGINTRTLCLRARALGEPPRKPGRVENLIVWPADFDDMWRAGVLGREIAAACNPIPKGTSCVTLEARRRKLKPRGSGPQKDAITIGQYRLVRDGKAVAEATRRYWAEERDAA